MISCQSIYFLTFKKCKFYHRCEFSQYKKVKHFSIDKQDLCILLKDLLLIFATSEFSLVNEFDIKPDINKAKLVSGRFVLLQTNYELFILKIETGQIEKLLDLKEPGLWNLLSLKTPSPEIIHIPQYKLFLISTESSLRFLDYNMKEYPRYPTISFHGNLIAVYFLHPCFVACLMVNLEIHIYLTYTGDEFAFYLLDTEYNTSACNSDTIFIGSSSKLYLINTPSLDTVITSLLQKNKYEIALEVCRDTKSSLINRVYFEYGIFSFFHEREYQRSSYYFQKSDEIWGVCALLRKLVDLPLYVRDQTKIHINKALETIQNYTIPSAYLAILSDSSPIQYDNTLKQKVIRNFLPYFQLIRKSEDKWVRAFSECWLFDALLKLPGRSSELLPVVADPGNSLPLQYCELSLLKRGYYNLLIELYLTRRVYSPALRLIIQKYEEDGSRTWLMILKEFLRRMASGIHEFLQYSGRLFCENKELGEELFLAYPVLLDPGIILESIIPHIMKYADGRLAINFLLNYPQSNQNICNELVKIYINEINAGNVKPSELVSYLLKKPRMYDPETVLHYFPKSYLRRERCIILDMIGRYEEIIHYYVSEINIPLRALEYVRFKKNPQATNALLYKLTKPPFTSKKASILTELLNGSPAEIFDHLYVI